MRCFYVLIHGQLAWLGDPSTPADIGKPEGFYCDRFILASSEGKAAEKALRRVRDNLDDRTGWLRQGLAQLTLEVDEIESAPISKLLAPENRGHTFYGET